MQYGNQSFSNLVGTDTNLLHTLHCAAYPPKDDNQLITKHSHSILIIAANPCTGPMIGVSLGRYPALTADPILLILYFSPCKVPVTGPSYSRPPSMPADLVLLTHSLPIYKEPVSSADQTLIILFLPPCKGPMTGASLSWYPALAADPT